MYSFQLTDLLIISLTLALIQLIILLDLSDLLRQIRNLFVQPFQIFDQLLPVLLLLVEDLVGLLLLGEGNVRERFGWLVG